MPSPFPGMDPYLEAPYIWPDCQKSLAVGISGAMNRALPRSYYSLIRVREECGSDDFGPDDEPIRHAFVEIRDARRDHALVTLIEILSPSNKRGGPDRSAYARKQAEVIASDASLVEIDLLRAGRRIYPDERLGAFVESLRPRPTYAVLVSEAWKREAEGMGYRVYRIGLREALPCVGIPLRADLPAVPLDLQYAFGRVYDTGPYRRGAVDYGKPPDPPLDDDDDAWADAALREAAAPPA